MLKQLIINEIRTKGAMPLDRYMQLCNNHYYATRDPFGVTGDFITAPEICQIFGEMIAIWAITAWKKIGSPHNFAVLEFGGGRGTLMADFLRAAKVVAEFKPQIHFVENSPLLREMQKSKIPEAVFHDTYPKLDIPTIIIANEFFDALPIKQFIGKTERVIKEQNNELFFNLPTEAGNIIEICSQAEEIMREISSHAAAGIIIDYGYLRPQGLDTLQAVRGHKFHHPLQNSGEADLTALVNFEELQKNCLKKSAIYTQREFLLSFGGDVRAKILGLENSFERLVNPNQMGELFKVLCF